jgi:hypothetical protein
MTSRFVNPKRKQTRLRLAHFAIAGLAALIAVGDHAGATDGRSERSVESIESRTAVGLYRLFPNVQPNLTAAR